MARAIADIEREIRALPDGEKERLLRALLEELDGPPDPGAEQAWLDEIQRRSREFDSGLIEAIPADKVFSDLRAKLARRSFSNSFPPLGKSWTLRHPI
jgi:putative addiction module component (TIGR02574 family)